MSKMQPVRGTHDLLPDEYRRFTHVIDTARDVARLDVLAERCDIRQAE